MPYARGTPTPLVIEPLQGNEALPVADRAHHRGGSGQGGEPWAAWKAIGRLSPSSPPHALVKGGIPIASLHHDGRSARQSNSRPVQCYAGKTASCRQDAWYLRMSKSKASRTNSDLSQRLPEVWRSAS
jgi:hypothetical protein